MAMKPRVPTKWQYNGVSSRPSSRLPAKNVPNLAGSSAANVAKGAYTLVDCQGTPDLILIGTGSEVSLCVKDRRSAGGQRQESASSVYAFLGTF